MAAAASRRFGSNNGNDIEEGTSGERVANRNGYRVFLRDALLADWLINRSVGPRHPNNLRLSPPFLSLSSPFPLPVHFDTE